MPLRVDFENCLMGKGAFESAIYLETCFHSVFLPLLLSWPCAFHPDPEPQYDDDDDDDGAGAGGTVDEDPSIALKVPKNPSRQLSSFSRFIVSHVSLSVDDTHGLLYTSRLFATPAPTGND